METKVEIKESIETVPTSNVSGTDSRKFPRLRGGGCCFHEHCCAAVTIIVFIVIGFIILTVAGSAYNNDDKNTAARNAVIAGAVILAFGILACLAAICKLCQSGCDMCCQCHLECC